MFDPYTGNGTIGLACALLGRHYVGCEINAAWAESAAARISAPTFLNASDSDRVKRWLDTDLEPKSNQAEGPSVAKAAARKADRDFLCTSL